MTDLSEWDSEAARSPDQVFYHMSYMYLVHVCLLQSLSNDSHLFFQYFM